jgi:hypothetical protein
MTPPKAIPESAAQKPEPTSRARRNTRFFAITASPHVCPKNTHRYTVYVETPSPIKVNEFAQSLRGKTGTVRIAIHPRG